VIDRDSVRSCSPTRSRPPNAASPTAARATMSWRLGTSFSG
jgi:hypothetical protein